jgi:hypothetical protein
VKIASSSRDTERYTIVSSKRKIDIVMFRSLKRGNDRSLGLFDVASDLSRRHRGHDERCGRIDIRIRHAFDPFRVLVRHTCFRE